MLAGMEFVVFPKKEPCYVASPVWYDAREANHQMGAILSDRIIVTSRAPDFSHRRECRRYCILGFDLQEKMSKDRVIPWRTAVSADARPVIMKSSTKVKKTFKITLIKLEKPITLGKLYGEYNYQSA